MHGELTRKINNHLSAQLAGQRILDPEHTIFAIEFYIVSTVICMFTHAIGDLLTVRMFHHITCILIIHIEDSGLAECEQLCFPVSVFLEACMLIRSDMIFSKVRKDSIVKINACDTVQHKSLGRDFHNYSLASVVNHILHILVKYHRLRCCILCRDLIRSI